MRLILNSKFIINKRLSPFGGNGKGGYNQDQLTNLQIDKFIRFSK